uniref:Seali n=1 Tax=Strongylocentrotus purpuratus TaxID=7668 RepID=B0FLQ9_STRPU|nr:seali [Strongylocentrotus purpuratus]ABY58155.1 seali [Strongylocentrotus purpuratus]
MAGFGRGGRGAALLKLLEEPQRRPGQNGDNTNGDKVEGKPASRPDTAPAPGAPKPGAPKPAFGRGLQMAAMQQQIKKEEPKPPGSQQSAQQQAAPTSFGRGFSGMPIGRGFTSQQQPTAQKSPARQTPSPARQSPSPPGKSPSPTGKSPSPSMMTSSSAASSAYPSPAPTPTPSMGPGGDTRDRFANLDEKMGHLSLQGKEIHGTAGREVKAASNYIRIKCVNKAVWQYAVSFDPPIESKKIRLRMVFDHSDVIGKVRAFDGAVLFLPHKLPQKVTLFESVRLFDQETITIKIILGKEINPQECTQIYNIIFRKVMKILQMKQVGRHFYNPTTPSIVPQHKLEIWPGYITAISQYEGGLMLHADVSHKVLCNESVLESMQAIYQRIPNNIRFREECVRQIVGTVVLTRYNNKTYRVDDIDWDSNPQTTFKSRDEEISFIDYYKKSYSLEISDPGQPLLISRIKKKQLNNPGTPVEEEIRLIPELSSRTGLTDDMRADFRIMKDLAMHTRVTPQQRHQSMLKFIKNVYANEQAAEELSGWGLELQHDLLQLTGRQLPLENIKLGRSSFKASKEADWGRECTRQHVITAVPLRNWVVVFTRRDAPKAAEFIQMMKQVCPQMGIEIEHPSMVELQDDRTQSYTNMVKKSINPQLQLVIAIFPTSRDDRYSAFKKLCCIEAPVPSQVINGRTISQKQKLRSVTQKIALQINCKLGGELWALDVPLSKLMVIGIDVYHDPNRGKKSIGAFVASMNRDLTSWFSRVCIQTPHQELIGGLKLCFTSSLKKYHDINHALPEKIVIFRDGVGDGQLNVVATYEQEQLSQCFSMFGADYKPQLCIVVVQKRINTRIFSVAGGNYENPYPGMVIDHTITRPTWYDFFLVSQHVRQGTVTPTHYVVVHDSTQLKPDHMQRLAYKLTHLYYNWPGTVRVPAPCQYAHKLAYLVGQNLHKEPSLELCDKLFFL